jgi:hypothetical protein
MLLCVCHWFNVCYFIHVVSRWNWLLLCKNVTILLASCNVKYKRNDQLPVCVYQKVNCTVNIILKLYIVHLNTVTHIINCNSDQMFGFGNTTPVCFVWFWFLKCHVSQEKRQHVYTTKEKILKCDYDVYGRIFHVTLTTYIQKPNSWLYRGEYVSSVVKKMSLSYT